MKGLSIEQKAKAYDKALGKAEDALNDGTISNNTIAYLQDIFPELKESEDEKIRKWIIGVLVAYEHDRDLRNAAIAWLEKQGEQNLPSANERAWLYLVSDVLTWKDGIGQYLDDGFCKKIAQYMQEEWSKKLSFEQNPSWSEEDKKYLEQTIYVCHQYGYTGCENWLKSLKDKYTWKPSEEQMRTLEHYMHTLICTKYKEILFGLYSDLKKLTE